MLLLLYYFVPLFVKYELKTCKSVWNRASMDVLIYVWMDGCICVKRTIHVHDSILPLPQGRVKTSAIQSGDSFDDDLGDDRNANQIEVQRSEDALVCNDPKDDQTPTQ